MPVGSTPSPSSVGFPAVRGSTGCCLPGTASAALLQLVTMCDSHGDPGCAKGTPAVRDHRANPTCRGTRLHTGAVLAAPSSTVGSSVLLISSTNGNIQWDGAEVCCASRNTALQEL